ncbi:MAG: cell wall hydrolase [Phenylobacterium zucineum]|nr:MAG: cell wall hydrolase [Phenylobacterium zucineum]
MAGFVPGTVGKVQGGGENTSLQLHETFSETQFNQMILPMSAGARNLALHHLPGRRTDFWGRPIGWPILDFRQLPDLGFMLDPTPDIAEAINALRPFSKLPSRPMPPFALAASTDDTARAVVCMTQAIYYEARLEPRLGQEAIAQVILNRLRHPAYPKSVCGVVYQGAARSTGCQFTFTCDGSMKGRPDMRLWREAETVARQALGGHVVREVGTATHYHAGYVVPYWAPTLVKVVKLGQHIFYRRTGPGGEPAAFNGAYEGTEALVSPSILASLDLRTQGMFLHDAIPGTASRDVILGPSGEPRTYRIVGPAAGLAVPQYRQGGLSPSRRRPTPEEIQRINAALATIERGEGGWALSPHRNPEDWLD